MCTVYKKIYLLLLLFPVLSPEISLSFMCCVLAKHPHDMAMENSPLLPPRLSAINVEDGERRNSPPLCSFVIVRAVYHYDPKVPPLASMSSLLQQMHHGDEASPLLLFLGPLHPPLHHTPHSCQDWTQDLI